MNEIEVIDIARDAVATLLLVSAPIMLVALLVGLAISLFQALTQIQEMTLTFVPKIVAVFLTILLSMPFILNSLTVFTESMFERITVIGEHDREME
jgi:flagellar biosynthetic protein FliQ